MHQLNKKFTPFFAWTLLCALLVGTPLAWSAGPAPKPSPAEVQRLIKALEESGALDAAIDRGVQRYMQKQKEVELAQQAQRKRLQDEKAALARPVDTNRDHLFGNPQARVSVILYDDLECPFCKRFSGTPERAIEKFKGEANFVFRHFPLSFHGDMAKRAAYLSECVGRQAGGEAFFLFVNGWLKQTISNGKGLERGEAQVAEIAQAAGAKDMAALEACARDPGVAQIVNDDTADGTRVGVTGTPSIVIRNNKSGKSLSVVGAVSTERLQQAIEQALSD